MSGRLPSRAFPVKGKTAVSGFECTLSFSLYQPDIKHKYIRSVVERTSTGAGFPE